MLAKFLVAAAAVGYANADLFARQTGSFEACVAAAVDGNPALYSLPQNPNYTMTLDVYNLDHLYIPSAVAYPTSADQVAALVKCASDAPVACQPQSGGHGYLNAGLGGQNGSLSIRLTNLNKIEYDECDKTLTFGTGNLLSNLTEKLKEVNRIAPYGSVGSIGTGGHFTIGGLGGLGRLYGLAADQILEVEVVLADGSIVTASAEENEDLFFAICGAAWSFGIVTSVKIKTQEVIPTIDYSYILPGNASTLTAVLSGWQALVTQEKLPREFAGTIYIYEGFALLIGSYYGSKDDFDKVGLSKLTANAISTRAVLDVLDQLNVTAVVNLFDTFEVSGLLPVLTGLTRNDVIPLLAGIVQIVPVLETGNLKDIQAAAEKANITLLSAAFAFLQPPVLEALFSNLTTSGVLPILSNTTNFGTLGPLVFSLNFPSIIDLVQQVEKAGFFRLLGDRKLSYLFELFFNSHIPTHFYSKSLKLSADTLPTVQATAGILNYSITNTTETGSPLWFFLYDLGGGAINDPAANATAYWHRDAQIWIQSYTVNLLGDVTDVQKKFLGGLSETVKKLVPGVDDSAYAGYCDDELANPQLSYWGGNVAKLKEIKAKYDLKNVFRNAQSIKP